MDPSQCTLVILSPMNYSNIMYPYLDTLRAVFEHDDDDTTLQQKYHHNTIFFMDVDTIQDCDDRTSISSSSSSCTSTMDYRLTWIKKITQHFIHHPVIVCSSETNATFMLDCLHVGVADYLLKPLYLPVVQTLFLKLHRRQGPESPTVSSTTSTSSSSSSSTSSSTLTTSTTATTTSTALDMTTTTNATGLHDDDYYLLSTIQPEDINHRFKEIVTKDIQLTKAMMDIYAPPLPFPTKYIPLSSRQADELKLKLKEWDFSPFEFNRDELIHCVYLIFEMTLASPELSHLTVTQDQLYDFIIDLANAYHDDNPYHNFAHAVDVLQCIYYFLCQLGVLAFDKHAQTDRRLPQHVNMQPKHAFALLLSAIGHDAGHPGVNNMFLINSRTPLAVMYNDRSVLESLHSMTLFQLIKKHGLDQWWSGDDYQCFRHIIISSILATDMALNNDYVMKFKRAHQEHKDNEAAYDPLLLCTALIKCADVSNVTRPFRRGKEWAELLVEEFASQGDLERELGMPVQATNDRTKIVLEECQIGFIRFVALDLFASVADLLPELEFTVQQMKQNLELWELEKVNQLENKQRQQALNLDILPTSVTTAGTKRRLSYCLESSTPPSLNTPSRRGDTNNPSFTTHHNQHQHHHHHHRHLNHHHYLDATSPNKKQAMDHPHITSPISSPPTTFTPSSTASSSTNSSLCILQ